MTIRNGRPRIRDVGDKKAIAAACERLAYGNLGDMVWMTFAPDRPAILKAAAAGDLRAADLRRMKLAFDRDPGPTVSVKAAP